MKQILWLTTLTFILLGNLKTIAQQKPNILIIISDDHARQAIGAYGNKLSPTPNIDRIANEGIRFDNAFVNNSLCGPSRAALLTGKYSHINGFLDNEHSNFDFSQDNFAKQLQNNGYQTAWIGKMHLVNLPQGFDFYSLLPNQGSYYNPDFIEMRNQKSHFEGYVTDIISQKSEQWLDHRDKSKPFCLVIGHKSTHRIWAPDTADLGSYDAIKFKLPDNFYDNYDGRPAAAAQKMSIDKDMKLDYDLKMYDLGDEDDATEIKRMNTDQKKTWDNYYQPIKQQFDSLKLDGKALVEWKFQRYMADYYSTAKSLDRNIGKTLDYLDKHNLAKNTIVIYLSDQGFYTGEHGWFDKRFMYEESFKTPMVMRYPHYIKPKSVSQEMVMNIDIAPTVLALAGAKIPAAMQGEPIPSVVKNSAPNRRAVYYHYYEGGSEHNVSPQFGIRTKRYKLIRFYDQVNAWELYDLKNDPKEMHNIYNDVANKKVVANLKSQLKALTKVYKDVQATNLMN